MSVKKLGWIVLIASVVTLQSTLLFAGSPACTGDTNDDGVVNVNDLTNVILQWGVCDGLCSGDTNGDAVVNVNDLTNVILQWGECPPSTCPFECADPLGCIFNGGVIVEDYECDGGGVCCEQPELDPCPYTCMATPFECMDVSGTHRTDFVCSGAQYCCEVAPLDPCPYDCVTNTFECTINGGTVQSAYSCSPTGACCLF